MADKLILEFQAKTDDLDKRLKAVEGSVDKVGKTSKKVASDMTKDLEGVKDVASQISPEFGRAASAMGALTGGVGKVVTAMKTLRGAIIATGIGALVVIIASVASAATRMQGVMDKLRVVFAGVSAAVAQVRDRMADFGAGLLDIVRGDFSEGFNKMKASVTGLGAAMSDANEKAKALEERLMTLERSKLMQGAATRKLEAEIQKLNATFGDETVSIQEQLKAQKEILQMREIMSDTQKNQARQLIALKLNQLEANEATDEFIEMMREQSNLQLTDEQLRDKAIQQLSKLGLSYSNIKDDLEPMIELINQYTDAESIKFEGIFRGNQRINALQNKIHSEEVERRKEEKRLEDERKKAADEAEAALAKAEAEAVKRREELLKELAGIAAAIDEQMNTASEDVMRREIAAAEATARARVEALKAALDENVINLYEYQDRVTEAELSRQQAVEDAERAHQERLKAIRDQYNEESVDRWELTNEQKLEAAGQFVMAFQNIVATAYANELATLERSLEAGQITREEFDEERKKLMRKQAEDQKALAILGAIINTAAAVTAQLSVPVGGFALAAIAAALGAIEIGVIAAQPIPQFAEGGYVDAKGQLHGRTHRQGGIHIEAEGGEFITKASQAKKYGHIVEAVNKGTIEKLIAETYVRPAVDAAILNGWGDLQRSVEVNAAFNDMNLLRAIDRHRASDKEGFKYLAAELSRNLRQPKRGYA
jgi:hypothetical protein